MSLKNLKSIFSNTEKFQQSDLTEMKSQHSVINEPQAVDFMGNDKVVGFTANLPTKKSNILGYGGTDGEGNWLWNNTSLYGEGVSIGEHTNLFDSLTQYNDFPNNISIF